MPHFSYLYLIRFYTKTDYYFFFLVSETSHLPRKGKSSFVSIFETKYQIHRENFIYL